MSFKESRLAMVNPWKYATMGKVHLVGGLNQHCRRRGAQRAKRLDQH